MNDSFCTIHRAPFPLLAVIALGAGCGESTASGPAEPTVRVDDRAPTAVAWRSVEEVAAAGPAEAVGVDAAGTAWTVIDGRAYAVEAGVPVVRRRFSDPGTPDRFGAVHRIRPRVGGGAWLATDTGLWSTDGLFVRHRPTGLTDVVDVQEVASGPFAGLWLATPSGVYRFDDAQASLIEADRSVQRLAVAPRAAGLVADGQLLLLTETDGLLFVEEAPFESEVRDFAATADALYAATDGGVYRWADGEWTHLPLQGEAVQALAVSGADLWARTTDRIVRFAADDVTAYPLVGQRGLTVDSLGDVWTIGDDGLVRASSGIVEGGVVTFSADVRPWIETHCAACHGNQTQDFTDFDVFRAVAADALTRVRSGDMPRCAGGVRCAPEDLLSPDDYAVLTRWISAGQPE